MQISIRPFIEEDADFLSAIYNGFLGKATLDTTPRGPDFFIEMMHKLEDRETMFIAEHEGMIAGYGILKKYSWKMGYYHTGEISIFLSLSYTGQGTGQQMMRQLIDQAKAWGYRHLVSRIMANNKGSIAFHEKLGYQLVGIQQRIGFAHGEWQDVAIMQLLMDGPDVSLG